MTGKEKRARRWWAWPAFVALEFVAIAAAAVLFVALGWNPYIGGLVGGCTFALAATYEAARSGKASDES